MSNSSKAILLLKDTAAASLTDKEEFAIKDLLQRQPDAASLSPSKQAELYSLFLNGENCEAIAAINPGISLGQVVKARLEGDWDERRISYTNALLDGIQAKAQMAQLESISYVSDLMTAVHKRYGPRVKKYIATGNDEDLGKLGIEMIANLSSVKNYNALVAVLREQTGQGDKRATITHLVRKEKDAPETLEVNEDNAGDVLEFLEAKNRKKLK